MEDLLHQISQMGEWWAYGFLFLSAYVENVFPPIPGDTVTVIGAYFVGTGKLSFWGVYISTTLGSILGFSTLFLLAYWLEWKFVEKYQPRWLEKSRLDRVENWFKRYGYWVVLANRFLSGARSVISIIAGLSRLNIAKVIFLAFISCFLWNGVLIYAGAFIGKNWHEVIQFIKLYNKIILISIGIALVIYFVYYFTTRKEKNQSS